MLVDVDDSWMTAEGQLNDSWGGEGGKKVRVVTAVQCGSLKLSDWTERDCCCWAKTALSCQVIFL